MKQNFSNRSLKKASFTAVTAGILVLVILCNVGISLLWNHSWLYGDMTPQNQTSETNLKGSLYTLSERAKVYLGDVFEKIIKDRGEENLSPVEIIFCADEDVLLQNSLTCPVYFTAKHLEKEFPERITVKTVNVWQNPSSVDAYRANSYASIYPANIIIASGSEFRVTQPKNFYFMDDGESEPWAYNGEQVFTKMIMAVTRAESPICCLTVNHGEPFANLDLAKRDSWEEYGAFVSVLENAGYEVRYLNLETDEIPENCRLIVTLNPTQDFKSVFRGDTVSEATRLSDYLSNAYSYLILTNGDTPSLPVLEEFLAEWGISFGRDAEGNTLQVIDGENKLNGDGSAFAAQYPTAGLGYSALEDMLNVGFPAKVVFSNAMPIVQSPSYETTLQLADADTDTPAYSFGSYFKNGNSRVLFDVFHAGDTSAAYGLTSGVRSDTATMTASNTVKLNLMTLSRQVYSESEGKGYTNADSTTFVCAVGSTDFVSDAYLNSASYGNTDVLLSMLRSIGKEIVPVGLPFLRLYDGEVAEDYRPADSGISTALLLTLIPLGIALGTGTVVLVRRKAKHH